MQNHGGGCLVDLAGFDAHEPILDMIDAPDAMRPGLPVQRFDERDPVHLFSIERYRDTALEGNFYVRWLRTTRCIGTLCPLVDIFRRLGPGILKNTAFDAAAPQVLINRVGAGAGDRY